MISCKILLVSATALLIASPSSAAKLVFVVAAPIDLFFGTFEQEFRYTWTVGPLILYPGVVSGISAPSDTPYTTFLKDRAGLSHDVGSIDFRLVIPNAGIFPLFRPRPLQINFGGNSSNTAPMYTHRLSYSCTPRTIPIPRPCPVYEGDYSDIRQIANFLDGKSLIYNESSQIVPGGGFTSSYAGSARIDLAASEFDPISGVPEPSMWAMMLGGFGLIGVIARRRTKVSTTVVQ